MRLQDAGSSNESPPGTALDQLPYAAPSGWRTAHGEKASVATSIEALPPPLGTTEWVPAVPAIAPRASPCCTQHPRTRAFTPGGLCFPIVPQGRELLRRNRRLRHIAGPWLWDPCTAAPAAHLRSLPQQQKDVGCGAEAALRLPRQRGHTPAAPAYIRRPGSRSVIPKPHLQVTMRDMQGV